MISDLFFGGKLKQLTELTIYDESFVVFYLNFKLRNNKFKLETAQTLLESFYGRDIIKNSGIKRFCDRSFICEEKQYSTKISEEDIKYYDLVDEFNKALNNLMTIDKISLHEMIEKEIFKDNITFYEKLKKCIVYYNRNNELTVQNKMKLLYSYFSCISEYYKLYITIDTKLESIPELFNPIEVTDFNLPEEQVEFLVFNNVFTLKNLKHIRIDSLICVFCDDTQLLIDEISKYAIKKEDVLISLKEKLRNKMKPGWDDIIKRRYEIVEKRRRTLADVGNELGLSRERIRQIENRILQKLLINGEEINKLLYCIYKEIKGDSEYFITFEKLYEYLKDELTLKYIILILGSSKLEMRIDEETWIIYNSKEITIEEIIENAKQQLDIIILKSEVEQYDIIKKSIIQNNYRLYKDKVYIKKNINNRYIYLNEIKDNFIEGYDIGNNNDYRKLVEILKDKYGEIEIPSMHSIQAMIGRDEFVQIDRGKYKSREYVESIPEKLLQEIIDFIIQNQPIVTYSQIYERFKEQLENIGINNRFYLKGCIDEKLPEEFNTGRDFINTNCSENYTTFDIMKNVFKSFEDAFTIENVKEKMPGLKNYNYENYARQEEENGLIQIGIKTYIYIEKLNITDDIKKELKEYIDDLFLKMDSKILTSKKIYASLSFTKRDLFNKISLISKYGDFGIFSIIQYLYKDEYYYSRPIISLEKDFTTKSYLLVKEYVQKLKEFKYDDVKRYIYKMNLSVLQSYLNFMDDLSDEFVQIGKDCMVRKEELHITSDELDSIKKILDLLLRNNEIRMSEFDGFFMLPKLHRGWNKYLLIGIIKTFFKDEYSVQNTTNYYDTTDFIVRRNY